MATIDLNATPPNRDHHPTDTQAAGLPTDITDRIPTLSPKEGLGSTHTVTTGVPVQPLNSMEAFKRAKKDARCDAIASANRIHTYGITDPKMLFEIGKIMLSDGSFFDRKHNPNPFALIASFIKDPNLRFELAKMIVPECRKSAIAELMTEFGITDLNERFELAKLRVQQNSGSVPDVIDRLKITDQNMLFEIAKILVNSTNYVSIDYLIANIKKLGITDQSILNELAKIIVARHSSLISQVIKELGITDPNRVFELAKMAIEKTGTLNSDFEESIATYGLTQEMRFELAKMRASRTYGIPRGDIAYYKITDQNMLFEIAKICAARSYLGNEIANFGITDPNMLFEIAKIAVINLASEMSSYTPSIQSFLRYFRISDSKQIYELFKIFIAHSNKSALFYFCQVEILSLVDQEHQTALFQLYFDRICDLALTEEDLESLVYVSAKIDANKKRLMSLLKGFTLSIPATYEKAQVEKQLREAYTELKEFAIGIGVSGKTLESMEEIFFKGRHSLQQRKKDLFWLCGFIIHYALDPALPQSPLCDQEIVPLLKCIGKITDPLLRHDATKALIAIYHHPDKIKNLKSLLAGKEERHYLFVLFSVSLGLETELTAKIIEELSATKYKDAAVMASIHQMMSALGKSSLTDTKKNQFLQQIFNPPVKKNGEAQPKFNIRLDQYRKNQRNAIGAVTSLLHFGQEQILKEVNDIATLVSRWQNYMVQVFEIKSDNLSNFFPTFCLSKRRPNGLMTYAARLQTLPKEEKDKLMPLLGKFAGAVLDGTFHQMRYEITNNRHMQTVFSGNVDLLKKWQTSLPIKITEPSVLEKISSPQERVQKLMRDALDNHHLEKESSEEIELLCQTVLDPKTEPPQLQAALESLQKLFPDPSSQFHHDLKGMIATLIPREPSACKWIIEDTDAWEDLLLMGTEPDHSCQHIERDPQFNKCVLASIWDPKIRLMVARDPESGKILGRIAYKIMLPKREIFVERLYINNGVNEVAVRRDLLEGCRQKAEVMGSTLVASAYDYGNLGAKRYPVSLQSLGGPAPYEYVDALSGMQKDGVYSLHTNIVLWSPPAAKGQ